MATAGKGLPFIGKMNEFLDRVLHPTVNKVGHSRAALDVTGRVFYITNGSATPLIVESGSDDNTLVCTGMNAVAGDLVRILSTANGIKEFEITVDEAPDADTAILAGYLTANLAAGDTFHLLRAVSEIASSDGASLATVISPPIQYNVKAAGVTTATTVLDDQDTPAASKPLPVIIRGVDGATITINAGDLTVSVDHTNDSIKLGDGTTLVGVTLANELKTHDADTLAAIGTLTATDFATEAKQDTIITSLGTLATQTTSAAILAELQLKADLTETQPVSIAGTVTVTGGLTDAELRATPVPVSGTFWQATQPVSAVSLPLPTGAATDASIVANGVLIGATNETAPATDTGISGLNGRLQRIAQRLTSLIALFPVSIGQKTMAGSLSVTLASDQTAISVSQSTMTASHAQSLVIGDGSPVVISAPGSAKRAKIMALDTNTVNLRVTVDGSTTATATVGMQFQAGRSEDYVGVGSISVIAESSASNQGLIVHWSI